MKKIPYSFIVSTMVVILLFAGFMIWGVPYFFRYPQVQSGTIILDSHTVLAHVTEIVDEGQITLGDKSQLYQVMQVEPLDGEYKGIPFQVDYGKHTMRSDNFRFTAGDEIYIII